MTLILSKYKLRHAPDAGHYAAWFKRVKAFALETCESIHCLADCEIWRLGHTPEDLDTLKCLSCNHVFIEAKPQQENIWYILQGKTRRHEQSPDSF